jgi:hypothetical protein
MHKELIIQDAKNLIPGDGSPPFIATAKLVAIHPHSDLCTMIFVNGFTQVKFLDI